MKIVFLGQCIVDQPYTRTEFILKLNQIDELVAKREFLNHHPEYKNAELEIIPARIIVKQNIIK